MRRRIVLFLLVVAVRLVPASSARGSAASTVGDPQKPDELPSAIEAAHSAGSADITIAPGTYDLRAGDREATILLSEWSDAVVHAAGVTLLFEEVHRRPLLFRRCKKVTWDGGTLRFARPAFTQGRVKAVGHDAQGNYGDWQIDAGYSTEIDPTKATYDIVDQSTRLLKANTGDWGARSSDELGPGLWRLRYPEHERPGFSVNDWLVCRAPAGSSVARMDHCESCTIDNVTFQNGGFATIFETGGAGGNHYLGCRIQPGPRPPHAVEDQLVGCGADGVHSVGTRVGPDIEDCVFSGVFLDDCIAVHGAFSRVVEADGDTIVLAAGSPSPTRGDALRISNMEGFFAQAICIAAQELPDHRVRVRLDQTLNVPVDHAQDNNPHRGTKANNPDRCGRGYRILRCKLGNTRSRGILVKADDGLIDRCDIEGCGMSAVSIGPEFWWNEANYAWNVTVSNNLFRECSKNGGDQATVWIHGDGAMGNRNISVRNNRFDSSGGRYVLRVEDADGVQIIDNQIAGARGVQLSRENLLKQGRVKDLTWLRNETSD